MNKYRWVGCSMLLSMVVAVSLCQGGEANLASSLKRSFSLERRKALTQPRYYRIACRYTNLSDVKGGMIGRLLVSGDFTRRAVGPRKDGCILDEFRWKNLQVTTLSLKDGTPENTRPLPFAEDFTYTICFENNYGDVSEELNRVFDRSKLPATLDGFLFFEQMVDAHSPADITLIRRRGVVQGLTAVGKESSVPEGPEPGILDFRPFGYFKFYPTPETKTHVRFTGLTVLDGQVAAVLDIGGINTPVIFDISMKMGNQTIEAKAMTQFWSQMLFSVEEQLPLRSTMIERTDNIGHCQSPGGLASGTLRHIELYRISEAEFKAGTGRTEP